jgi:hypothetical protein
MESLLAYGFNGTNLHTRARMVLRAFVGNNSRHNSLLKKR